MRSGAKKILGLLTAASASGAYYHLHQEKLKAERNSILFNRSRMTQKPTAVLLGNGSVMISSGNSQLMLDRKNGLHLAHGEKVTVFEKKSDPLFNDAHPKPTNHTKRNQKKFANLKTEISTRAFIAYEIASQSLTINEYGIEFNESVGSKKKALRINIAEGIKLVSSDKKDDMVDSRMFEGLIEFITEQTHPALEMTKVDSDETNPDPSVVIASTPPNTEIRVHEYSRHKKVSLLHKIKGEDPASTPQAELLSQSVPTNTRVIVNLKSPIEDKNTTLASGALVTDEAHPELKIDARNQQAVVVSTIPDAQVIICDTENHQKQIQLQYNDLLGLFSSRKPIESVVSNDAQITIVSGKRN